MGPRLLFDVGYLARRAYHAVRGDAAAVPGVVVAEALRLADTYQTDRLAFAFDGPASLRKKNFVWYKADRVLLKDRDAEEARKLKQLAVETDVLRTAYLPALGYRNVFHEPGYEADDGIASAVWGMAADETAIVVTQDSDLYQLLGPAVMMHRPLQNGLYTAADFVAEYGFRPAKWPAVTATAGGKNNMPGCPGVGIKTACKYALNQLPASHRNLGGLIAAWLTSSHYADNLRACRLPFAGCPEWKMRDDPAPADVPTRADLLTLLVPGRGRRQITEGIDR